MSASNEVELLRGGEKAGGNVQYWLKLLGCILAVKGVFFLVDHTPMFFLGDSLSYVKTATSSFIPRDRSFFYGWLIYFLGVTTGSLKTLVVAQVLASGVGAWLGAYILRNYLGASQRVAAVAGVVCAVEPLQLMYERYVMTEAFSLLAFAVLATVALGYMKGPSVKRILLVQMGAVAVVSLRVSYLPLVQATTVLAPMLAAGGVWGLEKGVRRNWGRVGGHLVLSVVLFVGMQGAYKRVYAELMRAELPGAQPAYYYENGFHLLCFVVPLVGPEDFPDRVKAAAIFGDLAFDLRDARLRDVHRWHERGLIYNVKRAYADQLEANRVAERAAWSAMKRNPKGELQLAMVGYGDYWDLGRLRRGMLSDQGGDRELPEELLGLLRKYFNFAGEGLPQMSTVTNRYFFASWGWYWALLLLPVPGALAIGVCRREARGGAILLGVYGCLQIAIIAAFSIGPTVRFLHSVGWLAVMTGGILWTGIYRWKAKAGEKHE